MYQVFSIEITILPRVQLQGLPTISIQVYQAVIVVLGNEMIPKDLRCIVAFHFVQLSHNGPYGFKNCLDSKTTGCKFCWWYLWCSPRPCFLSSIPVAKCRLATTQSSSKVREMRISFGPSWRQQVSHSFPTLQWFWFSGSQLLDLMLESLHWFLKVFLSKLGVYWLVPSIQNLPFCHGTLRNRTKVNLSWKTVDPLSSTHTQMISDLSTQQVTHPSSIPRDCAKHQWVQPVWNNPTEVWAKWEQKIRKLNRETRSIPRIDRITNYNPLQN